MKLPRNLTGRHLAVTLRKLDYELQNQTGSHIKLRTERGGRHSVTVPDHAPLKVGTLNRVLHDVARHHGLTRDALLSILFERDAKK